MQSYAQIAPDYNHAQIQTQPDACAEREIVKEIACGKFSARAHRIIF